MKKLLIILMVLFMFTGIKVKANGVLSGNINSINGIRYENYLVYYDYETNGTSPGTNQWGYEVAFNSDGVAVETNTNVLIPVDGFILSGHGTNKDLLMKVEIGDVVDVNLAAKTFVITRDQLKANKFIANIRLNDAKQAKDNAYNFGVLYDEVSVVDLILQIEAKVTQIDTASLEESQDLIEEINSLANKVIYMTAPTKAIEVRAVWHRPFGTEISESSLNGINRLMTKFSEIGINTIYLETFWNGYGSHRSEILETHPRVGNSFYGEEYGYDYVKAFIGEANKAGIDVHAWLHTFSAGTPTYKSVVIKDEWLVEDYQGNKLHPNVYGGSYYFDPSNEEVLEFVEEVIIEMLEKYDFKGIQYDYIRYYDNNFNQTPIRDSGYGAHAEEKFKAEYLISGDVRTLVKQETYRNKWNEWRTSNITNAVSRFSKAIHEVKPETIISAAVVNNLNIARNTYMQDWFTWVKSGYLDMLAPMIYTGSSEAVKASTIDINEKLGNLSYLVSGIAPVYYGYSAMINHEQVIATSNANGNALFASQNVIGIPEVEEGLQIGRYRETAINISSSAEDIIEHSLNGLKLRLSTYVDRGFIDINTENIFETEIDNIISMEKDNPGDLSIVLERIGFLGELRLYITNETIRDVVKTEVDSLYHTIDIKISRHLINYGYWDISETPTRPNPTSFEYPDEDEIDNGDEVKEEVPENNNVWKIVLAGLLLIVILISGILIYRKRKPNESN